MAKDRSRDKGMEIVFEDDWLIVVDKPSGLLTMSTGKGREVTAYSMLMDYTYFHVVPTSSCIYITICNFSLGNCNRRNE